MGVKDLALWVGKVMMPTPLKFVASVRSFTLPGSYYRDVKPIMYSLRLLGRLPVYITDDGLEKCPILSWPWLYSVVMLTGQIIATLVGFTFMFQSMKESDDYDEYLFWLMLSLILAMNPLVPCTFWSDSRGLTKYLKQWTQFQNEFFAFSKGPLNKFDFLATDVKAGSKNYIFWMSLINIPFVSSVAFAEVVFFVPMPRVVVFPYVSIFSSIYCASLFWVTACRQIMRISDVLVDKTAQAIKNNRIDELIWCRRCWIQLSSITAGLGSAMKNSALVSITVMSVSFVICMYACLSIVTRSLSSKYLVGIITEIPITLTILALIFNYSNNATIRVGNRFSSKLLSLDFSHLSPACSAEVNYFLQSLTLSPPTIRLADYVVVDRRLMTSFASNVITYLIVLLQFRDSGSKVIHSYTSTFLSNNSSSNDGQ